MDVRPFLILNPRGDRIFAARAEHLVESGRRSVEELQAALRGWYPQAVVRPRWTHDDPGGMIWYVYREGRWTAPWEAVSRPPSGSPPLV